MKLSLSDAWGTPHAVRATTWFADALRRLLDEHPKVRLERQAVLRKSSGWPPTGGAHFGALGLREALDATGAAADALDATLAEAVREWERRDEDFGQLGLLPAGEGRLSGRPNGCDVVLVKHSDGSAPTWRLEATLGPGWPTQLVLAHAALAKPGAPVALPRPFELKGATPERIERLFHGGEPAFSESLRRVCSEFPDACIEKGALTLTLGRWDARVTQIDARLRVVTGFLKQVQICTDWPERRRTGTRRGALESTVPSEVEG